MWSLNTIWDHLGWAVLHSLWQGVLVLGVVALIRHSAGQTRPSLSYASGVAGLVAVFAAFLTTLAILAGRSGGPAAPDGPMTVPPGTGLEIGAIVSPGAGSTLAWADVVPWLGLIWCAGFFVLVSRCMYAWARTRVMATVGLSVPEADWSARFAQLVERSGVTQRVSLYVSALVDSPVTLGTLKPIVLVPAGFLTGFPPAQVEAILLHELAHIRRHDFLLGLLQTAIRTTLYFNPAVRILSDWVNDDREQACDDFAVRQTGNATELAKALARLRLQTSPALVMSATGPDGAARKGQLVTRLERLMGRPARTRRERLPATLLASLLVGTVVMASAALPATSWAHPIPGEAKAQNSDDDKDDRPLSLHDLPDTTVLAGETPGIYVAPIPPIAPLPPIPPVAPIPPLPAIPPVPAFGSYSSAEDFEAAMEGWGERMEEWGESFEDNWGEEFEGRMEAWAEKMEDWGEHVEEHGLQLDVLDEMSEEQLRELGLSEADVEAYAAQFGLGVAEQVVTAILPRWISDDIRAEIDAERQEIDRQRIASVERAIEERHYPQSEAAKKRADDARKRAEDARERAHEARDRAERDRARAERDQARAERDRERAERYAERARDRAQDRAHREMDRELRQAHAAADDAVDMRELSSALRDQLEADGLLDRSKEGFDIKITDDSLHVCGRRRSDEMRERYAAWLADADLGDFDRLELEVDGEEIKFELRDGSSTTRVTMN